MNSYLFYYTASYASGQDDPNCALWLATRTGNMEPSCPLGTTRCILQEQFLRKPYNKTFIYQVCSVKVAGYWPRSFFASLCSSRSINTQKNNLANIQPSWPHTWSITHTYELSWISFDNFAQYRTYGNPVKHTPVIKYLRIPPSAKKRGVKDAKLIKRPHMKSSLDPSHLDATMNKNQEAVWSSWYISYRCLNRLSAK